MASTIVERTDGIKPPGEAEFGPAGTVVLLLDNGQLEIPPIRTLGEFRQWAHSDGFPEHVRIDYIAGLIEVDLSPQDLYCHGTVNGEVYAALYQRVKKNDLGQVFVNQTRLSSDEAGLSTEPDILFVSYESFESGKVQHVPKATDDERYVELRGGADLVVETISDGSVRKDTVQLPDKYYRANVTEFWLIDARCDDLQFQIYRQGSIAYEATQVDAEGYQYSSVMGCWYRLTRYRDRIRKRAYDLKEKPNS